MAEKPVRVKNHPNEIQEVQTPVFSRRRGSIEDDIKSPQLYGSARFIVNTWKSEQDRVKESIKKNLYLVTDPIVKAASEHQFRTRSPGKEIQPQMHFSNKHILHSHTKTAQGFRRTFSADKDLHTSLLKERTDNSRNKLYFKAAIDMYMQNGCMRSDLDEFTGASHYQKRYNILRSLQSSPTAGQSRKGRDSPDEPDELFLNPLVRRKRVEKVRLDMDPLDKERAIEYLRNNHYNPRSSRKPTINVRFFEPAKNHAIKAIKEDVLGLTKKVLIACNVQSQKSPKNRTILKRGQGLLASNANSECGSRMSKITIHS